MTVESLHPGRLPWFAAGTLAPAEAASIEQHVAGCAECRAEVDALRSMTRTLRAFAPAGHLAPELLVAYHDDRGSLSPEEIAPIETHLRGCGSCRTDLRALEHADDSLRTVSRRRLLGAAASILVIALTGWQIASWRAPEPSPEDLLHVRLDPPTRGDAASPSSVQVMSVRIAPGPCVLDVLLPVYADDGTYVARVQLPDGESLPLGSAASKEQQLSFTVGDGFARGPHVLLLRLQGGDATEEYQYAFDVGNSP